jgi:hypothetical protein
VVIGSLGDAISLGLRERKPHPRVTRHSTAFSRAAGENALRPDGRKLIMTQISLDDALRTAVEQANAGRDSSLYCVFDNTQGRMTT